MMRSTICRSILLTLIAVSLVGWGTKPNAAQETVLYRFTGPPDGQFPLAGLLADAAGGFYGTTAAGGKTGSGTVFKLIPSGGIYKERVLHSFEGGSADGAQPASDLIADKYGALYGTTYRGGTANAGTVFKLTRSGGGYTESVLYSFKRGSDGSNPMAGLLADSNGAFFGATTGGGASGDGTVFTLTSFGTGYTESVLYSFKGGFDGSKPFGDLIADDSGAIYGTTSAGGYGGGLGLGDVVAPACWARVGGCGTVFKLAPSGNGYTESVLYRFIGGSDGWGPTGALIWGAMGALYGTTDYGGGGCTGPVGSGTAFKLAPSSKGWYAETVISHFDCLNTGDTLFAGLIVDGNGVLYGAASQGRFSNCGPGCGAVFSLTPSGSGYNETTLYGFCGDDCNDGAIPEGRLVIGASGALYGTTNYGGAPSCHSYWGGCGTVFKLTP
ncbi:MAG TPA: choice-of-anchor tandem repeat GloVer-containing protein [Candidatus Eremiobacteraceae bacterium]|jgi:uncharacterized repeat protein (TIGR03803 family)